MPGIIPAITIPFLVTVLFMLALRPLAISIDLVDRPGGRKRHDGEIPLIGGLAMFAGFVIGSASFSGVVEVNALMIVCMVLLVVVGTLDDRFDLPPLVRLLAHIIAALIMIVAANVVATSIGPVFVVGSGDLGAFGVVFTVLVVVSTINAFNMFDGSDGVAGGQALACLLSLAIAAVIGSQSEHLPLIYLLGGSILGFLLFNLPFASTRRVRAFMGDAGSTLLGFSLAWIAVSMSQGPQAVIAPVTMLWIGALPLMDFFCSMVRRVATGRSPFHGDSEHLHHLLRRAGLTSLQIFLAETLAGLALGVIGVAGYALGVHDAVMFAVLLVLAVVYYGIFGSGRVFERELEPEDENEPLVDFIK